MNECVEWEQREEQREEGTATGTEVGKLKKEGLHSMSALFLFLFSSCQALFWSVFGLGDGPKVLSVSALYTQHTDPSHGSRATSDCSRRGAGQILY